MTFCKIAAAILQRSAIPVIAAMNERVRLKPFCYCHGSEKTKDAAMKSIIRLLLAFLCLSSSQPKARAVSPPPDGGYPGDNTAEGENALFNLNGGRRNTGAGFESASLVTRRVVATRPVAGRRSTTTPWAASTQLAATRPF